MKTEEQKLRNKTYAQERNKISPWIRYYANAKVRCIYEGCPSYYLYGARGIKFLLTVEEVKFMWFRDKANDLKHASLDRINSDGNYEITNCRFIEWSDNSRNRKSFKKGYDIRRIPNPHVCDANLQRTYCTICGRFLSKTMRNLLNGDKS